MSCLDFWHLQCSFILSVLHVYRWTLAKLLTSCRDHSSHLMLLPNMDFIELVASQGYKYCLVIIDMFSKYPEYPCRKQEALTVTKHLVREIIPQWGIKKKKSSPLIMVYFLWTKWSFICPRNGVLICDHHPQSAGAFESWIKQLSRNWQKFNWVQALLIVLTYIRGQQNRQTGVGPLEVLTGLPMKLPI